MDECPNEYRKIINKIIAGEIKTEAELNEEKRNLSSKLKLKKFINIYLKIMKKDLI